MATVQFGGKSCDWSGSSSLLESLESQGCTIPSSCRTGACQSCLVQAVDGVPDPEWQVGLKEVWKKQGYFLACTAKKPKPLSVQLPDAASANVKGRIESLDRVSEDVVRVRVRLEGEFPYEAGQFANLIRDDGLVRPYSLASLPSEDTLEFQVRRVPKGQMSAWLYDTAKVGDPVSVRGPNGDCIYLEGRTSQPLLLVGTGTGLAPLYGVLRDALRRGHTGEIHLIHAGQNRASLYLHEEMRALAKNHPQFHYWPSATETGGDPDISTERIETLIVNRFGKLPGFRVYLCGNPKMADSVKKLTYKLGVEVDDILVDSFISAPANAPRKGLSPERRWDLVAKLRFGIQGLTLFGFLAHGFLYYLADFKSFGHLFPFMAYDSLGQFVLSSALLAWTVIFLLTSIFGRTVCGWLCPLGFLQDAGEKVLKLLKVKLPPPMQQPRIARVITACMILSVFVLVPLIRSPVHVWQLDLNFQEPWLLGFPFRFDWFFLDLVLVFLVIGILLPLLFGPRPYCKLVCETGFLLGKAQSLSFGRIRRNHGFDLNTCVGCGKCSEVCPQGIDVYKEVDLFDRVVTDDCISCFQCVSRCPNSTIIYSLKKKMNDRGKVAGYLAGKRQRVEDLPRHLLTALGVGTGAYVGFILLPKSYFHTYLILASIGGAFGFLLYTAAAKVFEPLIKRWSKESVSQANRERDERIFPLSPQEKLVANPRLLLDRRIVPSILVTLVAIIALGYWAYDTVPPRISDVRSLASKAGTSDQRLESRRLFFGLPREKSQKDLLDVSRLAPYLATKTGFKVTLASGETYGAIAEALEQGTLDAAILPAGSYLAMVKRTGQRTAVLQGMAHGETSYASVILARDAAIQTIADLPGRSMAFTSIDSLSGYIVPIAALRRGGLNVADLGRVVMAGDHSGALRLLATGDVDAVATFEANAIQFLRDHPETKAHVISNTPGLPNDLLVLRPGLPPELAQSLVSAFEGLFADSSASPVAAGLLDLGIDGFQVVDERSLVAAKGWIDGDAFPQEM